MLRLARDVMSLASVCAFVWMVASVTHFIA
jgi:hypothetical protein